MPEHLRTAYELRLRLTPFGGPYYEVVDDTLLSLEEVARAVAYYRTVGEVHGYELFRVTRVRVDLDGGASFPGWASEGASVRLQEGCGRDSGGGASRVESEESPSS